MIRPVEDDVRQATLTRDEARWLAAYRQMDMRRREENLQFMVETAARYPLHGRPALRLVKGCT